MTVRFSAAALALALAGSSSAEVFHIRVLSSTPLPPPTLMDEFARALNEAHGACAADALLCPTTAIESALFGDIFPSAPPSMPSPDPLSEFLSAFGSDPFFRLAMTPPSASLSPRLLDEAVGADGGGLGPDLVDLSDVLDEMMETAVRFAMSPCSGAVVVRLGGGTNGVGEGDDDDDDEAAEKAVVAMSAMVDGLLDHAAASSASASADEEKDDDYYRYGYDFDEDDDYYGGDDLVNESSAGRWDPLVLSEEIAQAGRKILDEKDGEEEEEEEEASAVVGEFRRRRLTEENPDIRRRVARRLTEMEALPLVRLVRISATPGALPAPVTDELRLGYGPSVDSCLWRRFDENQLSDGCLSAMGSARLLERRVAEVRRQTVQARMAGGQVAEMHTQVMTPCEARAKCALMFGWCILSAFLVLACACREEDEDEEEEEEEENSDDYSGYVLVEDEDGVEHRDTVAFVGVPLRVI